jgi:type II secretory pathway component PulL
MKQNSVIKVLSLALVIAMIGLFIQVYSTSKAQNEVKIYQAKCDSLQRASDSLYDRLFPAEVELHRMQTAFEIFLKKNYKAAKQYADIISEETE